MQYKLLLAPWRKKKPCLPPAYIEVKGFQHIKIDDLKTFDASVPKHAVPFFETEFDSRAILKIILYLNTNKDMQDGRAQANNSFTLHVKYSKGG